MAIAVRHPKLIPFSGAIVLAVLIAVVDAAIKVDFRLAIAEFIPIAWAAERVSVTAGIAIAVAVVGWWLSQDIAAQYPLTPLWAIVGTCLLRLAVFAFLAVKVAQKEAAISKIGALARLDALTELGNRRLLEATFQAELDRLSGAPAPLSLLYLDIDNLKTANDSAGHWLGDRLLKALAQILLKKARSTDYAARIGGDEFVLILPQTDAEAAQGVARRIEAQFAIAVDRARAGALGVGLSVGIASWAVGHPPLSLRQALQAGDRAMYSVKRQHKALLRIRR